MGILINHEIVEAVYELLRLTPPFRGWKLPHADEVEFHLMVTEAFFGDHVLENGKHRIRLSVPNHKTLARLTETLAHEMTHMKDAENGGRCTAHHGKRFKRLARTVCRYHVFDPGAF